MCVCTSYYETLELFKLCQGASEVDVQLSTTRSVRANTTCTPEKLRSTFPSQNGEQFI